MLSATSPFPWDNNNILPSTGTPYFTLSDLLQSIDRNVNDNSFHWFSLKLWNAENFLWALLEGDDSTDLQPIYKLQIWCISIVNNVLNVLND